MKWLIVSIILALGAVLLAYNKIDGWGWFLFGCIITFHQADDSGESKKNND